MDIFSLVCLWVQCDSKRAGKVADVAWSPLALVMLFLFAAFAVMYCVTSIHA
jgi:hypothetical protein